MACEFYDVMLKIFCLLPYEYSVLPDWMSVSQNNRVHNSIVRTRLSSIGDSLQTEISYPSNQSLPLNPVAIHSYLIFPLF